MRVLAISYLFPNSIYPNYGIFVLNRLKAISKYCEVQVINPIPWFPGYTKFARYKDYNRIPNHEIIEGISVIHPRFFFIPRYFKLVDSISLFFVVIPLVLFLRKKNPFEIIDTHWTYPDLPVAFILSKILKKKIAVTVRGKEALYMAASGIRKNIVKYFLPKADAVIVLSESLAEQCVAIGVQRSKISVIINGVNSDLFHYIPQKESRKILNIHPNTQKILLVVGALYYGKGFDRIIKALPELLKKQTDLKLYIIGSEGPAGSDREMLKKLIASLSLEKHVYFLGEIPNENLIYWYNAADVFCLSSRSEGSPNVLTEALACGCPSIATNVGAVPEILSEDFLGMIMPNEDEIYPWLVEMFEKRFDRVKISNYMRKFDWQWCASQVSHVFRSLLLRNV